MLIEGQKIKLPASGNALVILVNESRARVRLLSSKVNAFETARGETVNFISAGREIDISPESYVEIL